MTIEELSTLGVIISNKSHKSLPEAAVGAAVASWVAVALQVVVAAAEW